MRACAACSRAGQPRCSPAGPSLAGSLPPGARGVAAADFSTAGAVGNKKASQGCQARASSSRNRVCAGLEAA